MTQESFEALNRFIEHLKEKSFIALSKYSINSVASPSPVNDWKYIKIKIKKGSSKLRYSGWVIEYAKGKNASFKKVDNYKTGFFFKNGKPRELFSTFLRVIGSDRYTQQEIKEYIDKIEWDNYKNHVSRINKILKEYFDIDDEKPIFYSSLEKQYLTKFVAEALWGLEKSQLSKESDSKLNDYKTFKEGVTKSEDRIMKQSNKSAPSYSYKILEGQYDEHGKPINDFDYDENEDRKDLGFDDGDPKELDFK